MLLASTKIVVSILILESSGNPQKPKSPQNNISSCNHTHSSFMAVLVAHYWLCIVLTNFRIYKGLRWGLVAENTTPTVSHQNILTQMIHHNFLYSNRSHQSMFYYDYHVADLFFSRSSCKWSWLCKSIRDDILPDMFLPTTPPIQKVCLGVRQEAPVW